MLVSHPLNSIMEIDGEKYEAKNGSMEVPDKIGLMLIETFGFEEVKVKKPKKSKED
jgi:hypothetical protein